MGLFWDGSGHRGLVQNARLRPLPSLRIKRTASLRFFAVSIFRLVAGESHDDFRGLLPIGSGPQIKIGNDLVERLQEEGNRLRIEVVGLAYNRAGDGSKGEPSTVPQ